MSAIALFGLDGIRILDEQSDRNLVYYFRHDLERLDKGQFVAMTTNERKRLINKGIISAIYMHHAHCWCLTDKGKRLLYSIEQEHKH